MKRLHKHKTNNGATKSLNDVGSPLILMGTKASRASVNGVSNQRVSSPVKKAYAGGSFYTVDSWLQSLSGTSLPPYIRAEDPFGNHAWVFAAAIAIAQTASQANYTLYLETEDSQEQRAILARKVNGGKWNGPQRGSKRKAIIRYLRKNINQRMLMKGLEPIPDHPLIDTLLMPNPLVSESQFFQLIYSWLSVRGEVFVLKQMEDGSQVPPGQFPEVLWPLSPDLFEPILEYGSYGHLVGWYVCLPAYLRTQTTAQRIAVSTEDVIQIKYPDPRNPLRGLSRIGAVAMGIRLDMMIKEYNKAILENGGDPGGVLTYDGVLKEEERGDFITKWEQSHKGEGNANRTALLEAGFKYTPLALSPSDMQHMDAQKWDREEVLAAMQVPPSILGVTERVNYSTQQGQIAIFWDKTILPMLNLVEQSLDAGLLYPLPDSIVGAFDISNVEALRFGLSEKIKIADSMTDTNLHMPPDVAYEVLKLEIPEYPDSDKTAYPVVEPEAPASSSTTSRDKLPSSESGDDGEGTSEPLKSLPASAEDKEKELKARLEKVLKQRVEDFIKVEEPLEEDFGKSYQGWVKAEKKQTLEAFDSTMKARFPGAWLRAVPNVEMKQVDSLIASFPDLLDSKNALKEAEVPNYLTQTQATFEFTVVEDFGGIPLFEIDDPKIAEYFNERVDLFTTRTPASVRQNLVTSLSEGFNAGETVQQLRDRVASVYNVAASDSKTLAVARTETGGFMNGVRDQMFGLQGIEIELWSTAGDEHVRDTHKQYGKQDAQPRGFNYLTVSNKSGNGELRFPGDAKCSDASEIVNCRCIKVPAG